MWVQNGEVTIQTLSFDLGLPLEAAGKIFLRDFQQKLPRTAAEVIPFH
jgi:hypothetical protein